MYKDHFYTIHKVCPCKIEEQVLEKVKSIYKSHPNIGLFVNEMSKQQVIGKKIWFDESEQTIYITKLFASDCGGGNQHNDSLIGKRCHCNYYNKSTEYFPKYYCKCSAEFYRPMFAPIFGENIMIEPIETVLSGDEQCTFAIRLRTKEKTK